MVPKPKGVANIRIEKVQIEEKLKMAPGFWGSPTSTLDWCEKNYEVNIAN